MLQTFGGKKSIVCIVRIYYSVFHKFRRTQFAYGVSILSFNQFLLLLQLAQKNGARFKSDQNWLKNNHLATLI